MTAAAAAEAAAIYSWQLTALLAAVGVGVGGSEHARGGRRRRRGRCKNWRKVAVRRRAFWTSS